MVIGEGERCGVDRKEMPTSIANARKRRLGDTYSAPWRTVGRSASGETVMTSELEVVVG